MKTYKDWKISSQKGEIGQWNNDIRKINEESWQLYGIVKKAAEERMNKISNFEELECEKTLNTNKSKRKS